MTDTVDYDRLADAIVERQNRTGPGRNGGMSASQTEDIVKRVVAETVATAVTAAVTQTLLSFGLDPADRTNLQRDFLFIRDMRTLSADSKKHIVLAVVGAITAGVVTAVWFYVKSTGKG